MTKAAPVSIGREAAPGGAGRGPGTGHVGPLSLPGLRVIRAAGQRAGSGGTRRAAAAGSPPGLGAQVGGPHPHPHQGGALQPRALRQPLTFCIQAHLAPGFITAALEVEREMGSYDGGFNVLHTESV